MTFKKISISILLLCTALPAWANLSKYSTEDLMEEVGRRVDALQNGGNTAAAQLGLRFNCSGVNINMVVRQNGKNLVTRTHDINDANDCTASIRILQNQVPAVFSGEHTFYTCLGRKGAKLLYEMTAKATEIVQGNMIKSYRAPADCIAAMKVNN